MRNDNDVEVPCIELTDKDLSAVAAGTFNFGDIKGESTDKDHRDWIQLLQYDHQLTQPPGR
jgi:type VI protein secretion system component Hcp